MQIILLSSPTTIICLPSVGYLGRPSKCLDTRAQTAHLAVSAFACLANGATSGPSCGPTCGSAVRSSCSETNPARPSGCT